LFEEVCEYCKRVADLRRKAPQIYAIIYNQLSIESEEVLAKDKNWNTITQEKGPFNLWKLMK